MSEGLKFYCCIFLQASCPILLQRAAAAHQMYTTGSVVWCTRSSHSAFSPPLSKFYNSLNYQYFSADCSISLKFTTYFDTPSTTKFQGQWGTFFARCFRFVTMHAFDGWTDHTDGFTLLIPCYIQCSVVKTACENITKFIT